MKNRPSNRGSRDSRARSQVRRSSSISSTLLRVRAGAGQIRTSNEAPARSGAAGAYGRCVLRKLDSFAWVVPLLFRACAGLLFMSTGWEAVHHLGDVTELFAQLHIPLPGASAVLAGYAELICGALVLVGLATRLAALPLVVCMVVALATAKAPKIHGVRDLLMQVELVYVVLLIALVFLGAGCVSQISGDSKLDPHVR